MLLIDGCRLSLKTWRRGFVSPVYSKSRKETGITGPVVFSNSPCLDLLSAQELNIHTSSCVTNAIPLSVSQAVRCLSTGSSCMRLHLHFQEVGGTLEALISSAVRGAAGLSTLHLRYIIQDMVLECPLSMIPSYTHKMCCLFTLNHRNCKNCWHIHKWSLMTVLHWPRYKWHPFWIKLEVKHTHTHFYSWNQTFACSIYHIYTKNKKENF